MRLVSPPPPAGGSICRPGKSVCHSSRNQSDWGPMDAVNRLSRLPLHQQLYDILRGKILSRQWVEGGMIPPESELTAEYKVSRIVVRQVLHRLVNEGLIYRQQGRGTFVSKHTLEHALSRILSFTEDMTQRGFTPTTQVLFADLIPAPHEIAERLQIADGTTLARIDRLRLADGEPMSIEEFPPGPRTLPWAPRGGSREGVPQVRAHSKVWTAVCARPSNHPGRHLVPAAGQNAGHTKPVAPAVRRACLLFPNQCPIGVPAHLLPRGPVRLVWGSARVSWHGPHLSG